jgi:hypothetical protein
MTLQPPPPATSSAPLASRPHARVGDFFTSDPTGSYDTVIGTRPTSAIRNSPPSPLQAQIDLALPPNRGLPSVVVRVDLAGLRKAGYDIPEVGQVGRSFGMPGGGYEMQFPYSIPPQFLKVIP